MRAPLWVWGVGFGFAVVVNALGLGIAILGAWIVSWAVAGNFTTYLIASLIGYTIITDMRRFVKDARGELYGEPKANGR